MSMRTMAFSSSNKNSARARAVSGFANPGGMPRNMKEPIGRFGSCKPLRARRTASDTALMAGFLSDHPLREPILHFYQLLTLATPSIRDTGIYESTQRRPARYPRPSPPAATTTSASPAPIAFRCPPVSFPAPGIFSVLDLGGEIQIPFALGLLKFKLGLL